jgi:mono/diheme cytochrome c family protein
MAVLGLMMMASVPSHAAPDGQALYIKSCKECHGVSGNGKGPTGNLLNPHIKQDLSDAATQSKLKDSDIIEAITNGVHEDHKPDGKLIMKPVKAKANLSDDDIKALVQYVRTLKH